MNCALFVVVVLVVEVVVQKSLEIWKWFNDAGSSSGSDINIGIGEGAVAATLTNIAARMV